MINNDNNEIALSLNYLIYYLVSRENLLLKHAEGRLGGQS